MLGIPPYSLGAEAKAELHARVLGDLTRHHYEACGPYRKVLDMLGCGVGVDVPPSEVPFIPVRLFKTHELVSVERGHVFKTMTSSGTSGQSVSRIHLDRSTASNQTKVLAKIASDFIGAKRLPMLVIDTSAAVRDRTLFSARGAGIVGFSMLGHDVTYALADDLSLDLPVIDAFLERHRGGKVLLFGFTFIVWEHLVRALEQTGRRLSLAGSTLIHGGGWKKLLARAVDGPTFKARLREAAGVEQVVDYYGMVEQTGSIFMECAEGRMHCSIFSDVFVRRHSDFSLCGVGERGLLQVVSVLPASYPGHSLITEDVGILLGEDDCPCGRLGKSFLVEGRIAEAEVRGCSDTHAPPD